MYATQWVLSNNTSTLDFRIDTVALDTVPGSSMPMILTDANICDTEGSLLYYTNGFYIAGSNGETLMNGDTLSPCSYTDETYWEGLNLPQAALFLPTPGNLRYYQLFHFSEDTFNRPNKIYHSVIDREANSGLGAVIEKNVPILTLQGLEILRGGGMTACKHANGRDYWIVMGGSNNNEFYKFLLTPNTVWGPFIQSIGPVFSSADDIAYSKFSQDGSKYVTSCGEGLVLVMDFDRCSGEFSNPITFVNNAPPPFQPISGAVSEEFSPNDRFLYVCNVVNLNQYDLLSDTTHDSIEVYLADSTDFYKMDMLQLALNGKLYGCTWNGGLYALHVINSPDSLGSSCGFVYGGQPTLSLNSNELPNMINYNLGSLYGSGCDTIWPVGIENVVANNLLRIMPNPADKYVYVEMGMQGNYEFDLLNMVGQIVDKKETRQVDNFDTERLASGIYFLRVIDESNINNIATKKLVVQH